MFFERGIAAGVPFFSFIKIENCFVHFLVKNNFCTNKHVKRVSVIHFVVTSLVVVRINFEQNL